MERTTEEIKKGLECCSGGTCRKGGCPYAPFIKCGSNMHDDAIEYILQLEEEARCADALLKDALACIKRLESQVPRWISVEERFPETYCERRGFFQSVSVIAFEKGRIMLGYFDTCKDDGLWCFVGTDTEDFHDDCAKPTHWMPLPEGPKEGE